MVAHLKLTQVLISVCTNFVRPKNTQKQYCLTYTITPIKIELESFLEELHHVTLKQQMNNAQNNQKIKKEQKSTQVD